MDINPLANYMWPLWRHMNDEHGLVLLDDECHQIIRAVDETRAFERAQDAALLDAVTAKGMQLELQLIDTICELQATRNELADLKADVLNLGRVEGRHHSRQAYERLMRNPTIRG